jgi:E3 ubiquitin-protein ligase UBR4
MAICIETVQKYSPQDVRTPVFIFERLCSIIYPEENDVGEFFLTLEKDPQQEDFLQVKLQPCIVMNVGYKFKQRFVG